jgi:2-oxo-4-hydroxy-4-carboxy--5-ureidoimidazoline (OHCU) decarboxylase
MHHLTAANCFEKATLTALRAARSGLRAEAEVGDENAELRRVIEQAAHATQLMLVRASVDQQASLSAAETKLI